MRIYLDNCSYNRPYDDQSNMQVHLETQSKLFIQKSIKEGKYDLVASYTLQYETSRNPFDMRRLAIEDFIKHNARYYVDYKPNVDYLNSHPLKKFEKDSLVAIILKSSPAIFKTDLKH